MIRGMKKRSSILAMALLIVALGGSYISVHASSVSFANFKFTSTAKYTTGKVAAKKTKVDNEQTYYYTITSQSGLGNDGSYKYLYCESLRGGDHVSIPLVLNKSHLTGNAGYFDYTGKGRKCSFYIYGDDLNSHKVTVNLSGRYTS